MKLTKQEQAMVARMRSRCEQWRTHRKQNIAILVTFIIVIVSGIDFSTFPQLPSLNELSHRTLLGIGVLVFWIGEMIRNWNGPPAEVLLLRLLDEKTEKHSEPVGVDSDATRRV